MAGKVKMLHMTEELEVAGVNSPEALHGTESPTLLVVYHASVPY